MGLCIIIVFLVIELIGRWRYKKMKNKKLGFNLIEVLVAVGIIMLLTGGILVYFNDFNSRQKIEGARIELIGNLKLARNYAVTRQKTKDGGELEYVYVSVENDNETNQAKVLVKDQDKIDYFDKFLSEGKPEVEVDVGTEFCFEAYSGEVKQYDEIAGACQDDAIESDVSITLSSEAVGDTKTVIINSSGLIYEGN
jgi:type II secretory pathway pseudopilin PulG